MNKSTSFRLLLLGAVAFGMGAMLLGLGSARVRAWPLEPSSAPEPPFISITRAGANAKLNWEHVLESQNYEVWRSDGLPYFDPAASQGNRIADLPAGAYGAGSIVEYIDDGIDRYAADGTVGPVTVIGDDAHNYFWVVRGRNGDGASEPSNRVGEFDFAVVQGG